MRLSRKKEKVVDTQKSIKIAEIESIGHTDYVEKLSAISPAPFTLTWHPHIKKFSLHLRMPNFTFHEEGSTQQLGKQCKDRLEEFLSRFK